LRFGSPDIMALEACVMKYKLPVPFVGVDATGDQAQMEADVHI